MFVCDLCLPSARLCVSAQPVLLRLSAAPSQLRQSGPLSRSDCVGCSERSPCWRRRRKMLRDRLWGWRRTRMHWGTHWIRSALCSSQQMWHLFHWVISLQRTICVSKVHELDGHMLGFTNNEPNKNFVTLLCHSEWCLMGGRLVEDQKMTQKTHLFGVYFT